MPPALLGKPDVADGLDWYLEAFWDLTSDRQIGAMGGAGPVPFSAIDRYAARYGIDDPDRFETFRTIMRAIDAVYLEHVAERSKAKEPGRTPKRL